MTIEDLMPESRDVEKISLARQVQSQIDSMSYKPHIGPNEKRHLRNVSEIKKDLRNGKTYLNCFEGATYAAYRMWTEEGVRPRLLVIYNDLDLKESAHAVCIFECHGKFYSIGQSRHPELKGKLKPYNSAEELAKVYEHELKSKGYHPVRHTIFNLDVSEKEIGQKDEECWLTGNAENLVRKVLEAS
jgi:hypothetical protein